MKRPEVEAFLRDAKANTRVYSQDMLVVIDWAYTLEEALKLACETLITNPEGAARDLAIKQINEMLG